MWSLSYFFLLDDTLDTAQRGQTGKVITDSQERRRPAPSFPPRLKSDNGTNVGREEENRK